MQHTNLAGLVVERAVDPELAALVWLLVEGEVPLVVTGPASLAERSAVAGALLSVDPGRPFVLLDADDEAPTLARLSALLRGGLCVGLVLAGPDLQGVFDRLRAVPASLPDDAIRRLGLVLVVDETVRGTRVEGGSLPAADRARRPGTPAAAPARGPGRPGTKRPMDSSTTPGAIMPELADRVDRSQADLEQRQLDRAGFLATMARTGPVTTDEWHDDGPTVPRHRGDEDPIAATDALLSAATVRPGA